MMKRGITPVIAVVLLILMTVSISALAFTWLQDFFKSSTENIQERQEAFKFTSFVISEAFFKEGEPNNLTLYVFNNGEVSINLKNAAYKIEAFYKANGTRARVGVYTSDDLNVTGDTLIPPQKYGFVYLDTSGIDWVSYNKTDIYRYRLTVTYRETSSSIEIE